jgi:hypothetical protein
VSYLGIITGGNGYFPCTKCERKWIALENKSGVSNRLLSDNDAASICKNLEQSADVRE